MILLINPKTTKPTESPIKYFREPNLGLLYLASILDDNNFQIEILDLEQYFHLNTHELKKLIQDKTGDFEIFGITALTNNFYKTLEISRLIKKEKPNSYIIFGGPHVSFLFKDILRSENSIDFICVGESERSFLKLVSLLEYKIENKINTSRIIEKLHSIKGIAWKIRDNEIIFTENDEPINLNEIPLPARYKLSQENYLYKVANIIVNRGCYNKCSFCSRQKLFIKPRLRSIQSIKNEIDDIIQLQHYEYINFYDNINMDRDFFNSFCKMLIKYKNNLPWGCELRADLISEDDARLLKEAGCKLVATGIESANVNILRKNFKYQDPNLVAEGIKNLKRNGLAIQAYFVLGLPGETEQTFHETLRYIEKLPLTKQDKINYFAATPYPGSRLWEEKEKFEINIIEKDFSKYDCEHVIFETKHLSFERLKELFRVAKNIEKDFKYD